MEVGQVGVVVVDGNGLGNKWLDLAAVAGGWAADPDIICVMYITEEDDECVWCSQGSACAPQLSSPFEFKGYSRSAATLPLHWLFKPCGDDIG